MKLVENGVNFCYMESKSKMFSSQHFYLDIKTLVLHYPFGQIGIF